MLCCVDYGPCYNHLWNVDVAKAVSRSNQWLVRWLGVETHLLLKPVGLSLSTHAHIKVDGENQLHKVVF